VITKGFRDLLEIGNQARPRIFDLNIKRALPLYSKVLEVDERVTLGMLLSLLSIADIPSRLYVGPSSCETRHCFRRGGSGAKGLHRRRI
jgi:N-methylhydantoinase A/oxoprolinase/acetone carboxylase beta subunit